MGASPVSKCVDNRSFRLQLQRELDGRAGLVVSMPASIRFCQDPDPIPNGSKIVISFNWNIGRYPVTMTMQNCMEA